MVFFLSFGSSKSSVSSFVAFRSILILLFLPFESTRAADFAEAGDSCPEGAGVDLSFATPNISGLLSKSGYFFPHDIAKFENGVWRGCICDIKPCLAVCPSPKETEIRKSLGNNDFLNESAIPPVYHEDLTIIDGQEEPPDFHFVQWDPCRGKGAFLLNPKRFKTDAFQLLKNGTLFRPGIQKAQTRLVDFKKFCLRLLSNDSTYTPRICSVKNKTDEFRTAKYIGALVGVPFLIATVIVYSVLPELRNIHGTTLRCYLSCLVVTYITLAADRIPPPDSNAGTLCLFLGFTIYFTFLASFFWLNVMCFDMWWRLGGFGSLQSSGRLHDRKKFIGYSIYAWGSAVILTAICIGMEFSPSIPANFILPGFKSKACWFSTKTAAALYFFGPVGVIIACNIFLFISTSIKLVKHREDTQRHLNTGDSKRHDDNKQWFSLHVKLSIIMGISWSTEVISWLWEGPKYLWYVTDMVNALQGILIFVIFVWKRRIWKSLVKRYRELEVTRYGCSFKNPNPDSPLTTACSDDSTIRCSVSVLALEDMKISNIQNPESIQNSVDHQAANSRNDDIPSIK